MTLLLHNPPQNKKTITENKHFMFLIMILTISQFMINRNFWIIQCQIFQLYCTMNHICLQNISNFQPSAAPKQLTFNRTFCRRWNSNRYLFHIGFDLVQMFLTEMLHCVSHWVWFKHTYPLQNKIICNNRHRKIYYFYKK
jgi:hypothetical protein